MSAGNETIADIVADKRVRANALERVVSEEMATGKIVLDQYAREFITGIRKEADRIEAAWKRERDELVYSFDQTKALCSKAPDPSAYAIEGMKGFDEWKRNKEPSVGNSAALREAVVLALSLLDLKEGVPYKTVSQKDIDFMKAALAAPPRNCDVGTPEERLHRYHELCREISDRHERIGEHAPSFAFPTAFEWEDRPYEKGGAE